MKWTIYIAIGLSCLYGVNEKEKEINSSAEEINLFG